MENKNGDSPWADLPSDILGLIFSRLPLISYLRAAAVCKSWASIPESTGVLPLRELPWLMMQKSYRDTNYSDFFSPLEDKSFRLHGLGFDGEKKLCCGSSHGLLFTVQEGLSVVNVNSNPPAHIKDWEVYLFNPFSKAKIDLPPLSRCPVPLSPTFNRNVSKLGLINKIIMSCTPTTRGCVVVALTSFKNIAYCRPGDYSWRVIDGSLRNVHIIDLVFYKGKLYVLDTMDAVWYCSDDLYTVAGSAPSNRQARLQLLGKLSLPPPRGALTDRQKYLVECKGELLLVVREIGFNKTCRIPETREFKIYQFVDLSRCISLEDQMLFLSKRHSESYTASEELLLEYGFYSMEDRSVGQFLPSDLLYDMKSFDTAIWVSPIPWFV